MPGSLNDFDSSDRIHEGKKLSRWDEFLKNRRWRELPVYRDGLTMIEILIGTLRAHRSVEAGRADEPEDLGVHTLRGEIVDSQCNLGVMNPGYFRADKFAAEETSIRELVLRLAGESVSISGRIVRSGDTLRLQTKADATPSSISAGK